MNKKLYIVLILAFTTTFTFGQKKTKKITEEHGDIKEVYYVLKDSTSIKQGAYQKWDGDYYIIYGHYNNDERCGVWETYNDDKLILSYDYDSKKLALDAMNVCFNDTALYHGSQPPFFINSKSFLNKLKYEIRYPQEARENGEMGTVVVSVTIDTLGKPVAYNIKTSVSKSLNNETLRVFQKLLPSMQFYPGLKDGKYIESVICIPCTFNLQ